MGTFSLPRSKQVLPLVNESNYSHQRNLQGWVQPLAAAKGEEGLNLGSFKFRLWGAGILKMEDREKQLG